MASLWSKLAGLPRRRVRVCLAAVAVTGLVIAWWRYPSENRFSILTCTISFLGSPDPDRNPHGWRFYQVGMTALLLLLSSLVVERHVRLRGHMGKAVWPGSAAIAIALTLLLMATWIPDSREFWLGYRAGDVHTRLAILAIPVLAGGILWDGLALWWSGVPLRALWPFHLYAFIVLFGTNRLMEWDRMCRQDPTLPHWPGKGLHSTPLWEWIAFGCLVLFLFWMARRAPGARKLRHRIGPRVPSPPNCSS